MNNNRFYVYFLIDPRTNKPFYVGKGTRKRDIAHLCEAKKDPSKWSNPLKCRRINSILNSNGTIVINRVFEDLTEQGAIELESHYIKWFGQLINNSGILTNIINEDRVNYRKYKKVDQYTLDGKFIATYDSVQEAAGAAGVVENTMSGVINERTHNNKTLRTAGGYRWCHHGKKLSHYDRYNAIYEKKKKKICQYTLTGEYIKTFDSAKQANEELGVSVYRLSNCCNKKRLKTVDGYCWAFEGEFPILPNLKLKRYTIGTTNVI